MSKTKSLTCTVDMEYSLLTSRWHCPSLGITMPAILLSIPKCESASLTNTSKRIESFLQPILSYQETHFVAHPLFFFFISSSDHWNNEADRTESQTQHLSSHLLENLKKTKSYPTNSRLHDGVKATLWHIDVSRYALPCDYLVELVCAARQRQEVFISKRWQAGWAYRAATQRKSKDLKNKILWDTKWHCWNFQPQTYIRKRGCCWSVWSCFNRIPAGVGQLFFCDLDEGQDGFLHKRAKAHSKFTGEVSHLFRQRGAQAFDHLQIIDHGRRQVHQVVDVHRIILRVLNLDLESHLTACAKTKSTPYFYLKNEETTSGGKSSNQNAPGCVPGRSLSAIFCGEIWVLLTLPVFFPSGRSCRIWPLETGNSSWPLPHPFSSKISSLSHLSLTENQSVKFWEMKEQVTCCAVWDCFIVCHKMFALLSPAGANIQTSDVILLTCAQKIIHFWMHHGHPRTCCGFIHAKPGCSPPACTRHSENWAADTGHKSQRCQPNMILQHTWTQCTDRVSMSTSTRVSCNY